MMSLALTPELLALLVLGVFLIAFLYSSVGHAGASGYIAVMSLLSIAPEVIKPTALSLNILVASIGAWHFWKAGYVSWNLFWPFAILSVPFAYVGGYLHLPAHIFEFLLGCILLLSAVRFIGWPHSEHTPRQPPTWVAVIFGGCIGLLAGLTGTGGGIFLTPLLLFMHWANVKTAAAVSVLFILVNSIAGLTGNMASTHHFPPFILALGIAAALGGSIGSYLGSRKLKPELIKRLLAAVLLIAGIKLIL